jgi:putative ABC transport system permease protein
MSSPARLAWRQLTRDKVRFAVAVAGVTFAVVLMLVQLGFRSALLRSSTRFHERLAADLVLISPQSSYLVRMDSFPKRRLDQALGAPGVAAVAPVYTTLALWKNPETGLTRTLFLIGIDPDRETLRMPELEPQLPLLRRAEHALFDRRARREYGPVTEWLAERESVEVEVNDRRTYVAGLFGLGTSFGIDGSMIVGERTFLGLVPRPPGMIEIGLVRLEEGANAAAVQADLRARLDRDVLVLTRHEYAVRERTYWNSVTPIGYMFGMGVLIGFGVGAIVVSQILFADVHDHLAEYATLKAIGYSDRYLYGVVLAESVLLAALGFLPGLGAAHVLFGFAADATNLPMELSRAIAAGVLGLTLAMCCASGVAALRKLRAADPAEIF